MSDTATKVSNNGHKKLLDDSMFDYVDDEISYEFHPPTFFVLLFTLTLSMWGVIKTLLWAILIGIFKKLYHKEGFKKNFKMVWYSFPNSKNGNKMYPGPMVFYGMFSQLAEGVRKYSKTWRALDIIYRYRFGVVQTPLGRYSDWWCHHRTCEAVRNRLKLSKKKLREVLIDISEIKSSIKILSIACGAAQGVIEVISELEKQGIVIEVTLVDYDKRALEYAKNLAKENGVIKHFNFKRINILKNLKSLNGKYDVIEMIGLLDYLEEKRDNTASKFIKNIKDNFLYENGYFLTANILYNWDMLFVRFVINWWMIYRTKFEINSILVSSGFEQEDIVLEAEPHKVHCIAVCRNSP